MSGTQPHHCDRVNCLSRNGRAHSFWEATYRAVDGVTTDTDVLFKRTGRNSGNLLIGYSLPPGASLIPRLYQFRRSTDLRIATTISSRLRPQIFFFGLRFSVLSLISWRRSIFPVSCGRTRCAGAIRWRFPEISPGTKRFVAGAFRRVATALVCAAHSQPRCLTASGSRMSN